jgi:hypothetical protein
MWGTLSDERMGLSFVRVNVSSNESVVSMYMIFTFYVLLNINNIKVKKGKAIPIIGREGP